MPRAETKKPAKKPAGFTIDDRDERFIDILANEVVEDAAFLANPRIEPKEIRRQSEDYAMQSYDYLVFFIKSALRDYMRKTQTHLGRPAKKEQA